MIFMVIERFKDGDAKPVYRRFLEKGRLAPDGLKYIESWVETDFARCFQLVECEDESLLRQWMAAWQDLVDFEFVTVVSSEQAVEMIKPLLSSSISST
ncbi:MAG: DUF3303 family protein [Pyrinomonadaceae bacterium]